MSDELIRAEAEAVSVRPSERRIDVRLVRWGEVAENTEEGVRETFERGAFSGVDPSTVTLESSRHGGALVGVGEEIMERDQDAVARFRVAETPAGDELLALARPGPNGEPAVLRSASVVFKPIKSVPRDGVMHRQAVDLRRVAIIERGAYRSAAVLAVRSDPMSDPIETLPAPPPVDLSPVLSRLDAQDAKLTELATLAAVPSGGEPPTIYRHASLGEYHAAVLAGEEDLLRRTIADQITTNNAGVLPPSWITDVKRIVDLGRRAITAFGGPKPLPETGTTVSWPYLGSSNTVVGQQSTQKTEVTSARVDISKGDATVVTYAGGSDISYQLLQRSSPSYIEAYDRIMLAEWGKVTDAAFCTALEGATGTTTQTMGNLLGAAKTLSTSAHADDIIDATGHGFSIGDAVVFTSLTGGTGLTAGRVYWVTATSFGANTFRVTDEPGGAAIGFTADISAGTVAPVATTGIALRQALAQASVAVEDATGQPASIALAGLDVFLAAAALTDIVPSIPGNPSNASGTLMASDLVLNVSGLRIVRAPGISNGKIVISNPLAAAWLEDGPRFISAEDVHLLGRDVAVYSFAAPAIFAPAGIVEATFV